MFELEIENWFSFSQLLKTFFYLFLLLRPTKKLYNFYDELNILYIICNVMQARQFTDEQIFAV